MIKIRHGFFETNSSSTHAIILGGNIKKQKLHRISTGCYGWEQDCLGGPNRKASYIYTLFCTSYPEHKDEFLQKMEEITGQSRSEMFSEYSEDEYAYIDHGCEYNPDEILSNLETIIFGDGDILTGNDNGGADIDIPEGSDYIYKRN